MAWTSGGALSGRRKPGADGPGSCRWVPVLLFRAMQIRNLRWVALFALAMAYIEAATVVYLRRVFGITDLIRDGSALDPFIARVELGRELATLLMILAVGWAAGKSRQSRLGFAFFAFGLWDILYYAWLKVFLGWPESLLTPDILFLVPLPWWGPVLGPVLVALLCMVGGALAVRADDLGRTLRPGLPEWLAAVAGAAAVLYAFMADALAALPADAETLNRLRPTPFNWPVYLAGLALMTWSVWRVTRPAVRRIRPRG